MAGTSEASSLIAVIEDEAAGDPGAPTRARKVLWKCVNGGLWYVNSLEKGEHAFSYAHNQWQFTDFYHVSLTMNGLTNGNTSCSLIDATPKMYLTSAIMDLTVRVTTSVQCRGQQLNYALDYSPKIVVSVDATP